MAEKWDLLLVGSKAGKLDLSLVVRTVHTQAAWWAALTAALMERKWVVSMVLATVGYSGRLMV